MRGKSAFHERVGEALEDDFLRRSVRETQDRLREGRLRAAEDWGDWEALRSRGEAIRRHTVENLDVYLDRFAERVEEAGGRIFFRRHGGGSPPVHPPAGRREGRFFRRQVQIDGHRGDRSESGPGGARGWK